MLDSSAILKCIESQHGLLVQRAINIYSFSHLSFHEYFTAVQIVSREELYPIALERMNESRWREVFLLAIEKLENSDSLLTAMKRKSAEAVMKDSKACLFLNHQARLNPINFTNTSKAFEYRALRAYLELSNDSNPTFVNTRNSVKKLLSQETLDLASKLDEIRAAATSMDLAVPLDRALNRAFDIAIRLAIELHIQIQSAQTNTAISIIVQILGQAAANSHNTDLALQLHKLCTDIEECDVIDSHHKFWPWWSKHGSTWTARLQQTINSQLGWGNYNDVKAEQAKSLQIFYENSKLIVDCLNSECYISREVRQQIEDTLLIPPSTPQTAL